MLFVFVFMKLGKTNFRNSHFIFGIEFIAHDFKKISASYKRIISNNKKKIRWTHTTLQKRNTRTDLNTAQAIFWTSILIPHPKLLYYEYMNIESQCKINILSNLNTCNSLSKCKLCITNSNFVK
jgi:hypothetical protein